jgi:hypothetical protein
MFDDHRDRPAIGGRLPVASCRGHGVEGGAQFGVTAFARMHGRSWSSIDEVVRNGVTNVEQVVRRVPQDGDAVGVISVRDRPANGLQCGERDMKKGRVFRSLVRSPTSCPR